MCSCLLPLYEAEGWVGEGRSKARKVGRSRLLSHPFVPLSVHAKDKTNATPRRARGF